MSRLRAAAAAQPLAVPGVRQCKHRIGDARVLRSTVKTALGMEVLVKATAGEYIFEAAIGVRKTRPMARMLRQERLFHRSAARTQGSMDGR